MDGQLKTEIKTTTFLIEGVPACAGPGVDGVGGHADAARRRVGRRGRGPSHGHPVPQRHRRPARRSRLPRLSHGPLNRLLVQSYLGLVSFQISALTHYLWWLPNVIFQKKCCFKSCLVAVIGILINNYIQEITWLWRLKRLNGLTHNFILLFYESGKESIAVYFDSDIKCRHLEVQIPLCCELLLSVRGPTCWVRVEDNHISDHNVAQDGLRTETTGAMTGGMNRCDGFGSRIRLRWRLVRQTPHSSWMIDKK